jgi:kynureninase
MTDPAPPSYADSEAWALAADAADPLGPLRAEFEFPIGPDGRPLIYFCGNSLGLMPRRVRSLLAEELDEWSRRGVEAHMQARKPWYSYHENFRETGARLVGALPGEVVMMNSLTVNLHLMMVTFYRPTAERFKIVIEEAAFPSDTYAVTSHLRSRGYDPAEAMIVLRPDPGRRTIATESIERLLAERGSEIALLMLPGVQYYTGQCFDLARITAAGHRAGTMVGFDLAHAAGNVVLRLHDWEVDFAAWCSYKYLNAGSGAVAGCFIHERHGHDSTLPRYAGWWGNDPATRFRLHLNADFVPRPGADGWQLSNPPLFSMVPLLASLEQFDRVGMAALRRKSERLTGYLEFLLDRIPGHRLEIITPRDPAARGCQLSLMVAEGARELFEAIRVRGIVGDFRQPDVIRLSPTPLYNSFWEVWRAAGLIREALGA